MSQKFRKLTCRAFTIIILVAIGMQIPVIAHFQGKSVDPVNGGLLRTSQETVINTEEIEIILAMPESFDVNEPIYAVAAAIRNAKATYVKPESVKFEIYSDEFGDEFIIGNNRGEYDGSGNWVTVNQAEVKRLNNNLYYTKFSPFLFDANLTMRVTVEWLAPWRQIVQRVFEKNFVIGQNYNITGTLGGTREQIKSSILDKVDIGVSIATTLVENVDGLMEVIKEFLAEISEIVNFAGVDPGIFNYYVVDFIGNSTNRGPMYDIVKHDLYSHLSSSGSVRDNAMDARHAFIMNSINDSLGVLTNKIGSDTDASDGYYNYTVTFVRDLYELYAPDAAYIDPADAIDSLSSIVYSNEQGNITGGSFDDAYAANGQHEVSLEFLLEPITGAHPKFKSPLGTKYNIAPPRKSIVINTMGPYFPILNSWYDYYELDPSEEPSNIVVPLEDLPVGLGSEYVAESTNGDYTNQSRLVLDNTNPMVNIRRLALKYNPSYSDGGCSIRPLTDDDMYDNYTNYVYPGYIQEFYAGSAVPVVNYGRYAMRLASGMTGHFYYWINVGGGKPFSRMTRDITMESGGSLQRVSDNQHEVIVEIKENPCTTSVLSGTTVALARSFDLYYYNRSMFQVIDAFARITGDNLKLEVDAAPIGSTNTEYYKINPGRWVDAFFNGTDLSRLHGALGDSTYITAAPNTASPYYSPKSHPYSFVYEDTWSFYSLGLLSDYQIPNEYTWIPFVGPNQQVPIGWMPSSDIWYSVVGTEDLRMGLEYLYGGIYMGYKQTVLSLKNMAVMPVLIASQGTGIPEERLDFLLDQADALDEAWANLDLLEIDKIGARIVDALSSRGAGNGGNIMRKSVERIANLTNIAYAVVGKDEKEYSFIDTGLDTAGSDLTVDAVGDALKNLIETNIRPALAYLSNQIQKVLGYMSAIKDKTFDAIIDIGNNLFEAVDQQIKGVVSLVERGVNATSEALDRVGSTISDLSYKVNDTLTNAIGQSVSFTQESIQKLGDASKSAYGHLANYINNTILEGVKDSVERVANATITAGKSARDYLQLTADEAQARADATINQAKQTGEIIGGIAGGVAGAVAGGYVGGPAGAAAGAAGGAIGGALLGGAIGEGIGNIMATGDLAAAAAARTGASAFQYGIDAVTTGRDLAVSGITAVQNGINGTIQLVNKAIDVGVDYSTNFVQKIGDVTTGAISFGSGIAQDFGDVVGGFGAKIQSGVSTAVSFVEAQLDKSVAWTKRGFDQIIDMNLETLRAVIRGVTGQIKSTLQLVSLIITVLQQVTDIFEGLVDKVNDAFDLVADMFSTVATFLIDLAGTGINLAIDFSNGVAQQLQTIEEQIASSSGFYRTIESLLSEVRDSRTAASLIEYATQTIGVTKEIFFKWIGVVQPVSRIKGGDTSFRVFQMGNVFTEKLYFVTIYQGELVAMDEEALTASRLPPEGTSVPGGLLEANLPLFKERYDNGSFIDGIYYASFNTSNVYDWFGDSATPFVTEAAPPTTYLTRFDANFTAPSGSPHDGQTLNQTWLDETELFDETLTVDAFPILEIISEYDEPITGGSTVPLLISVTNEMFSKPVAEIEYSISTNTGFVIANRRIGNIILPSSDEGAQAYELEFSPLGTTPAGTYDLLVTVVEPNGDTTTQVIPVTIRARTVFEEITGFFVGLIGAILGFFGLGAFIVSKKKNDKTISGITGLLGSFRVNKPSNCSLDAMGAGNCSINGVNLDCDPELGTCKFDL